MQFGSCGQTAPLRSFSNHVDFDNRRLEMATASPIVNIQDPGTDLAKKTVFIKLHLGLLGNSRKVSSSRWKSTPTRV